MKAVVALVTMAGFYFGVLSWLGGGWNFAWGQFSRYWYLVALIMVTFATQVYLTSNIPKSQATGSALSMVACCAHHVTEVLPFLGLFSVAAFLVRYQVQAMTAVLVFNIISLIYIIWRRRYDS